MLGYTRLYIWITLCLATFCKTAKLLQRTNGGMSCLSFETTAWRSALICNGDSSMHIGTYHDDVIKWKHFPRYWSFVRGIHMWPANSPHKGQWRGAWLFSLICARINGWANNGEAGDLRRHRAHYDVTVMSWVFLSSSFAVNRDIFKSKLVFCPLEDIQWFMCHLSIRQSNMQ